MLNQNHESYFGDWWIELHNGFNLLFYGYGSKRAIITGFGKKYCAKHGHVVVVNGFSNQINLKTLISMIEKVPGLTSMEIRDSGPLGRIYNFFQDVKQPPLYLIIHNIEATPLRDQKSRRDATST